MSDMTPMEEAEAFLDLTSPAQPGVWIGKAWGADHNPRYLTYGTVRALVAQIKLDEQRLNELSERIARMLAMISDYAIEETAQ